MQEDHLVRFHFRRAPVRGMWVRLTQVWADAIKSRLYSDSESELVGQTMATVALIANNVKHDGGISLHAVGSGPVKTAFAECQGQTALRGIVRPNEDGPTRLKGGLTFKQLLGEGRMALTIEFESGESYQGLVDLQHPELAANIEHYFATSEQLDSVLQLNTASPSVTGFLLQRLPSRDVGVEQDLAADAAEWFRLVSLFRTIQTDELAKRDFGEHCTCTRERCSMALRSVGVEDLRTILEANGAISVQCEFCGRNYRYVETELEAALKA